VLSVGVAERSAAVPRSVAVVTLTLPSRGSVYFILRAAHDAVPSVDDGFAASDHNEGSPGILGHIKNAPPS